MTPRELLQKLQDMLEEEKTDFSAVLSVPQWYHLKAWFDRTFYDSYYDPRTPCPHDGTRWQLEHGVDRCGQCGRRIIELVTEETSS